MAYRLYVVMNNMYHYEAEWTAWDLHFNKITASNGHSTAHNTLRNIVIG